jgi:hypothetical protein
MAEHRNGRYLEPMGFTVWLRDRNRAWEAPPPWDGALGLVPTRGRNTRISQLPDDRN